MNVFFFGILYDFSSSNLANAMKQDRPSCSALNKDVKECARRRDMLYYREIECNSKAYD